jgi:hypothetical protein
MTRNAVHFGSLLPPDPFTNKLAWACEDGAGGSGESGLPSVLLLCGAIFRPDLLVGLSAEITGVARSVILITGTGSFWC